MIALYNVQDQHYILQVDAHCRLEIYLTSTGKNDVRLEQKHFMTVQCVLRLSWFCAISLFFNAD